MPDDRDVHELSQRAAAAVLETIVKLAPEPGQTQRVLRLAEAYAWLVNPVRPHGDPGGPGS